MKSVVIIGAGGFAKELYSYLQNEINNNIVNNYVIKGFLDINRNSYDEMCLESKYLGHEDNYVIQQDDEFIVAIGNSKNRKKVIEKLIEKKASFFTYIHNSAIISNNASIGNGVIICPNSIIQAHASIGDYCVLNVFTSVGHDSILGENSILSPYSTLNGNVIAGKNLFMGTKSSILLGTKVGENCSISAHTAVKNNIGDNYIIQDKVNQVQVKNRLI
jgi:sugar O-acyltransferase (sialic acid O-acetyltransferase NeuD family)